MNRFDYISHSDALLKVERYTLSEGKAAGVQMIRAANARGLEFHVAADRCMDITELRCGGKPIHYSSGTGITHPAYYEPEGYEWLRSFHAGFLTTCGLNQVGEPCEYKGVRHGIHGRISNCPAEHVSTDVQRDGERLKGHIDGIVRQARQQGENIELRRSFEFDSESMLFKMTDEISNRSSMPEPFMVLYHFNFGYPFLTENTKVSIPIESTKGWNPRSEEQKMNFNRFYAPGTNNGELTLLHRLNADENGMTYFEIESEETRLRVSYLSAELPYLGQWTHLQTNDYVLGIEPCNNNIRGVAWEAKNNTLCYLEPGESRRIQFTFELCNKGDKK